MVIDEEQRFGVAHKERIKEMKANVDVLTLTATPIPRTLQMAILGIKNMSAFMIKMALDGYCVKLDLKDVKELVYLLRMCSNNLNQYAKKANETGSIYQRDIVDLRVRLDRLWENSREIVEKLSEI